jgi:hypothetical protein
MPPQEKQRMRSNYQQYREMNPQQRQDFQRRYDRMKQRR